MGIMLSKSVKYSLLLSIVILTTAYQNLSAQNIETDTIRWNASKFTDLLSNTEVNKPCQFISYHNSSIKWLQKNGELVYVLTVNSVTGDWSEVNVNGTMSYDVSLDAMTGTISFSRSNNELKIVLDLRGGSGDIKNEYSISNFEIL